LPKQGRLAENGGCDCGMTLMTRPDDCGALMDVMGVGDACDLFTMIAVMCVCVCLSVGQVSSSQPSTIQRRRHTIAKQTKQRKQEANKTRQAKSIQAKQTKSNQAKQLSKATKQSNQQSN
jgi:hypothetical protein